ncbi:hypothetical protein [Glycomyces sp. YM15]|uniref:hypothetical protein n=1 Tax=Glycomyces sp. YM15 TaxID=2800446 RepID=UPI001963DBD4|nr:hypothetical protein [Glycomyces sp. YM15]
MNDIGAAGNAVHGKRRIWVPLAVVGALLALIAAEAVFARSQPAGVAVVPDTVIEFGSGQRASVQVGDGWVLDSAASDVNTRLVLVRGDMAVELSSVTVPAQTTPEEMWAGMDRLLDIERRQGVEVRLDTPTDYENASGATGLQGKLQVGTRVGQAFVLAGDEGGQAVEAQVLAPAHAGDGDRSAAAALIDSIAFEEAS